MNRAQIIVAVYLLLTVTDWFLALWFKDTSFLGKRLENLAAACAIAWAWEGRSK